MTNSYTICLCILVAVQAVSCLPEGRMNPMIAKKFLERSFSTSPSDEASTSRDPYDTIELAPIWLIPGDDTSTEEALSPHHRVRRHAVPMDLGLRRHDDIWNSRNVGTLHGFNRNNYHANMGAGMSMFGRRSRNGRHSVGVGATVDRYRGRHQGSRYRSRSSRGGGIGYSLHI